MRISCEFCGAEYELDEAQIPVEGLPIKCARCLGVFVAKRAEPAAAAPPSMNQTMPLSSGGTSAPWDAPSAWSGDASAQAPAPPPASPTGTMAWTGPASEMPGGSWEAAAPPPWPSAGGGGWDGAPTQRDAGGTWDVPAVKEPAEPPAPMASWETPSAWDAPAAGTTPGAGYGAPGAPAQGFGDLDDDQTRLSADPWAPPAATAGEGVRWDSPEKLLPATVPHAVATRPTTPSAPTGLPADTGAGGPASNLSYFDLFGGDAERRGGPAVEVVQYALRRADGLLLGQYDQMTVRAHLQIGKLTRADEASTDGGMSWQPLAALSEFSDLTVVSAPPSDLARVEQALSRTPAGEVTTSGGEMPQVSGGVSPEVSGGSWPQAHTGGGLDGFGANAPVEGGWAGAPSIGASRSVETSYRAVPAAVEAGGHAPVARAPTDLASSEAGGAAKPERPSWLAPAVTSAEGRASLETRRQHRRRRIGLYAALGAVAAGGLGFFILYDPGFGDEEKAMKRKIALDEPTISRYRAQSRSLLQVGTFRAYTEARSKLASVIKHDPNDRVSKALYLQAMLYLIREYGQTAIVKEAEKVRNELAKAGESGVEFRKAKISYALWKKDLPEATRTLDLLLAANPDDREGRFLQGMAMLTPKDGANAIKVFDQLIALDAKNAKYLRAKAEALLLSQRDAGIAALRDVLSAAPANAGAALRLAEIYIDGGRREDGKRLLTWLVDPQTPARREASPDELARAQSALGRISFDERDIVAARKAFEGALKSATSDNERVRAMVGLGDVLIMQREYRAAIQNLEAAKQKAATSPDVLARLATAYARDGQSKNARAAIIAGLKSHLEKKLEELTDAQKNEHAIQGARLKLSSALVNELDEIPRLGEAVDDYRAALDYAGKVSGDGGKVFALEARVRLASLLRRQRNFAGAMSELDLARALDASSPQVHNGYGELHAEQGETAKAEAAFRKALESDARTHDARFNLGTLLSDSGRTKEGLALLEHILGLDPKYPGLHLAMAVAYQRRKQVKEAIDAFERAIKQNPEDARVYLSIGKAYFEFAGEESFKRAREYLDKAIEKNKKLNEAYYWRARVLMELGKPEIALDDYKTASDREPDNGRYRIFWGAAFEKMGSYRDAFFQYTRAIEDLRKQRNEVDIAMALYRRGKLRLDRDEIPAALKDLEEAIRFDPKNIEVLVLLGDSLSQARRHAQAVIRYRAALESGKKLKGLWYKLGRSLLEVNQRAEAKKALANAAAEDPTDCYPHYFIGYLHKDAKQEAAAIRSLRKFLSLCQKPPEMKDVLRDIADMETRLGRQPPP